MESDETSGAPGRVDFFVSHAGRDQVWAEWLAWQLIEAGYTVELDAWDWAPGQDFIARMQRALHRADRLLAIWSEAYFRSAFGGAELRAAFVRQVREQGRIVPVLVEPAAVPDLYASLVYVDLVGLDEAAAADRLRTRLTGQRPATAPRFPTSQMPGAVPSPDRPVFAGRLPAVWNVRPRNPHFTGRGELLIELRRRLSSGEHTLVVQALHGLGGVGKTQLAIEYAHRFASDYDLVWWIDGEQPALLAGQLAALAGPLGLPPGDSVAVMVDRVRAELRYRPSWLLIFDNAQRPQDLLDCWPGGGGQVLVTSRYPGWGGLGGRVEVDVLARSETVALLRRRLPEVDEQLADRLAAELGDLPLATAQAAGYLEATGLPAATYLGRFRTRRASLLERGDVIGYQGRLDTTWTLSLERLAQDSPAAVQLLRLAAFLAPDPIPLRLFTEHAALLAEPLRTIAADTDDLDDIVGMIVGFSLARRQADRIQLHRLVQAIIRHRLSPSEQQCEQARALALLAAAHPDDPNDRASWDVYAELAAHVLAIGPLADDRPGARQLVLDTTSYLQATGDSEGSRAVSAELLDRWRLTLGPDHPDTLSAASNLATALYFLGEAERVRTLAQDTVERCRRSGLLGPDHHTTLLSAAALANALVRLGELQEARALAQDTVERCRRSGLLGPDHHTTLLSAAALNVALVRLGESEQARALGEDTLERCRRVYGPDALSALYSAATLTMTLVVLGDLEPARALGQDAVERCRRVLGPDHPTTLFAATALTFALVLLAEPDAAWTLRQGTVEGSSRVLRPNDPTTLLSAPAPTNALLLSAPALANPLVRLGELQEARALAQDTVERCRRSGLLGPDHHTTLLSAAALANALVRLGELQEARALGQDTVERCRRSGLLGPDHHTTLLSAAALANALVRLGELQEARALGQDTVERCRRVYGPDDLSTLYSAATLTMTLVMLGDLEPARALGQDTVDRCRRVLGPDHPTTLFAATALTIALGRLGELQEARVLGQDTVDRCRRVLDPNHPTTLLSAASLTPALSWTGELELARALREDTEERCRRVYGADHLFTLFATQVAGGIASSSTFVHDRGGNLMPPH